jgi:hypothetical protein
MKKLNLSLLSTLNNTFASLRYNGEVKCVKKARTANEVLAKAIKEHGGVVALEKSPLPFNKVMKSNQYTVSIGAKLQYKRKAEAVMSRGGNAGEYTPEHRNLGMFPVFSELLWVKNDLSEIYVRAYQVGIPKPAHYFADGKEVPQEILGQWLPSDDYKRLSGEYVPPPTIHDADGDEILQQDEDGNLILDEKGNPCTMALPPIRSIKLSNCQLFKKGQEIKFFTDEDWSEDELIAIREAFYAKFAEIQ